MWIRVPNLNFNKQGKLQWAMIYTQRGGRRERAGGTMGAFVDISIYARGGSVSSYNDTHLHLKECQPATSWK